MTFNRRGGQQRGQGVAWYSHQPRYWQGIDLFNQRLFFDAHEVLEDVWRQAAEGNKKFLQGLVQLAVSFHHHSKGNLRGAQSLIEKARRNLAVYPEEFGGIRVNALLREIDQWKGALHRADSPQLPRVEILPTRRRRD